MFDLSPATLTDGCRGLISLTNNNWSSVLTVTFGDVYLGSNYAAKLSGDYVADDSNVLDFSEDAACTSLDLSAVSQLPASLPWLEGTNRVAYVGEGSPLKVSNVVVGSTAEQLSLSADGGDFRPAKAFTAGQVSFACPVDGLRLLMLPFNAVIPDGAKAYALGDDLSLQQLRSIPAHTPVLVEASGTVAFTATDAEVAFATSALTSQLRGTYVSSPLFAGDYVLGQNNGQWGLVRLGASSLLSPFDCYAALASQADFIPFDLSVTGIQQLSTALPGEAARYDLQGRRVGAGAKGLHIVRSADGKVRKVVF